VKQKVLRALLISAILIIIFASCNLGLKYSEKKDFAEQKPITNSTLSAISAQLLGLTEKEAQFFIGLNIERINAGLPLLLLDPILVKAARYRSQDMARKNYFSHEAPDGSTVFDLLDSWDVPYTWAGENLARNNYPSTVTVAEALRKLMTSPSHRAKILLPNYIRVGVGYARDKSGMHYFTTIFTDRAELGRKIE